MQLPRFDWWQSIPLACPGTHRCQDAVVSVKSAARQRSDVCARPYHSRFVERDRKMLDFRILTRRRKAYEWNRLAAVDARPEAMRLLHRQGVSDCDAFAVVFFRDIVCLGASLAEP